MLCGPVLMRSGSWPRDLSLVSRKCPEGDEAGKAGGSSISPMASRRKSPPLSSMEASPSSRQTVQPDVSGTPLSQRT